MRELVGISLAAVLLQGCAAPGSSLSSVNVDPTLARAEAIHENATAVALVDAGDYAAADKHLALAIAADPSFGPAHNNLGHVRFHQAQPYLAAVEFDRAAKLMPQQAEPLNNLGLVYETTGKLDDAASFYARAVKLEPANPAYRANWARARVRKGERSDELRQLLTTIADGDSSADWAPWARSTLAKWNSNAVGTPNADTLSNP